MSSSTVKMLVIFALLALAGAAGALSTAAASQPFFAQACRTNFTMDYQQCIRTLGSNPRIVSAKTLYGLSISIIEAGISSSNMTKSYIDKTLKKPHLKPTPYYAALRECNNGYAYVTDCFRSAVGEVREKEYDTASYDLFLASSDAVGECKNAVAEKKIRDTKLIKGNQAVEIFAFSASTVVDKL